MLRGGPRSPGSRQVNWLRRKRATGDRDGLVLYHASDVHGSDQCWRKFLGAARFYHADVLIMGGDLTGKAIVPIVRAAGGEYVATLIGEERKAGSPEALEELFSAIRYNGMYPWVATPDEVAAAGSDSTVQDALFESVMLEELRRWMALADERIPNTGGWICW